MSTNSNPRDEAVAVIRFSDAREPEIISWRLMPKGEHPVYAAPAATAPARGDRLPRPLPESTTT